MKTIYVKYCSPEDVYGDVRGITDEEIKAYCFRVAEYQTEAAALERYANTHATWSTLLEKDTDVKEWINKAYEHIKARDTEWLEHNFT